MTHNETIRFYRSMARFGLGRPDDWGIRRVYMWAVAQYQRTKR